MGLGRVTQGAAGILVFSLGGILVFIDGYYLYLTYNLNVFFFVG